MVDDGLFKRIPVPDVALAQHLLPGIAWTVATCPGPFMSAADSIRVTVHGRAGTAPSSLSCPPSSRCCWPSGSPCLSSPTAELGWATRAATRYGSEPRRVLDQRLSTSLPLKRTPRPRSRCMISGTLPAAEALP
jgi:hypothetical protein